VWAPGEPVTSESYHRAMRALGIHCTGKKVFLAITQDGELVDDRDHEQLDAAAAFDTSERLVGLLTDVERTATEVKPDVARVLMPEQTYEDSYARIAPRAAFETVVRLGFARRGVPVEVLHRATARSRVGMSRSGKFDAQIPRVIAHPVGRYWNAGRRFAAIAALAEEQ
jgi:hypothetical protein